MLGADRRGHRRRLDGLARRAACAGTSKSAIPCGVQRGWAGLQQHRQRPHTIAPAVMAGCRAWMLAMLRWPEEREAGRSAGVRDQAVVTRRIRVARAVEFRAAFGLGRGGSRYVLDLSRDRVAPRSLVFSGLRRRGAVASSQRPPRELGRGTSRVPHVAAEQQENAGAPALSAAARALGSAMSLGCRSEERFSRAWRLSGGAAAAGGRSRCRQAGRCHTRLRGARLGAQPSRRRALGRIPPIGG